MTSLTQFVNDSGERFWRSLPAKFRPGTKAHTRYVCAQIRKLFRPGKFPVGMGSSGIYGVRRT